jgi:DNA repair exonuclease SbcCD ATPase subunit
MEKFDDPVVDSCGHTFNKHHIMAHFKVRSKDGSTFPCPLNPSKMLNVNELSKNYSLIDAMEETDKVIAQTEKSLEERISNLENLFAKSLEQTEKNNRKMSKNIEALSDMYEKAEQLKSANKIRKKQTQNLLNMSLRDRINCVFFCSYLTEVQNRGLDRFELDYLKDRVILNKPF